MDAGLDLNGVTKSFGSSRVLDDVTLNVRRGEFVSLVGPSGCGKSTLLRIIAGLELQDSGRVSIGDNAVDQLGPRARNIAMVFQNYALYPHMSAHNNIALPLTMSRLSLFERLPLLRYLSLRRRRVAVEIAREVSAVAEQLRIESLLARKPAQLSGGQRQRVALARAMVRRPSLFLMDEPLSNLDAQLRVHMRDELSDLHKRLGGTFLYVTHDQVEAMTMSDRVAMMDCGRLAQVGTPSELYDRPATLSVARFIGSPMINILDAEVAGGRLMLRGQPLPVAIPVRSSDRVFIGIRPEDVVLAVQGTPSTLTGRVHRVEHHGADRLVYIDLDGAGDIRIIARVTVSAGEQACVADNAGVSILFNLECIHVFGADGLRLPHTHLRSTNEHGPARAALAAAS